MVADIIVKIFFLILNVLFVGVGGGLLALGVMGELKLIELGAPDLAQYQVVPIVLIVVGAFVILIAFLGCCGAVTDSNITLAVYAIIKVLLMIVFLGAGVLLFVKQDIFVEYLVEFEKDIFHLNQNKFMEVESKFKCCGPEGIASYSGHPSKTCCIDEACSDYRPKCSEVTATLVHDYGRYIAGGFIGIAGLELLGAVMSLCVASMLRRYEKY